MKVEGLNHRNNNNNLIFTSDPAEISLSAGIYKNSIISSDSVSVNYMLVRDCRNNDQTGTS